VAFGGADRAGTDGADPEAAAELVDERLWPEVERQRERLLSHPGVIAAGLAALGVAAGVTARRRRNR